MYITLEILTVNLYALKCYSYGAKIISTIKETARFLLTWKELESTHSNYRKAVKIPLLDVRDYYMLCRNSLNICIALLYSL